MIAKNNPTFVSVTKDKTSIFKEYEIEATVALMPIRNFASEIMNLIVVRNCEYV